MKLVVVGPTWPFRGGLAHYTTTLVSELRRAHDVRLITFIKQYPQWLFPGNVSPDPSSAESALQVDCDRTLIPWSPLTWLNAAKIIHETKPDMLILQWWTPFWAPIWRVLAAAAHRAGAKVVYICHQFIEPDAGLGEWLVARESLKGGDAFITHTEEEFVMAKRAFIGRVVKSGFLPIYDSFHKTGITRAQARQQLGLADEAGPVILFFGFVRRYKGLRFLLEAMAQMQVSAKLLIAGEFWEEESDYRAMIERLGLQDRVLIHNRYVTNEEIEPYFAAADILALPYINGSQSAINMLGLHYGLPVVASDVGGLAETVMTGEMGLLVPPSNSAALAHALDSYFQNNLGDGFRRSMSARREQLSWSRLIKLIEDVCAELKGASPT